MKYLKFTPYILILVLFSMWYFANQSRIKCKDKSKIQTYKHSTDKKIIDSIQSKLTAVWNSKQKTDTIWLEKKGEAKKVYNKKPKQKPIEGISKGVNGGVKILYDSIIDENITINYAVKYAEQIYNIDLSWTIKQKEVQIQNIVYQEVPYEVIKEVPINTRNLYIGLSVSSFNGFNPYLGIIYTDKKKRAYTTNYNPLNSSFTFGVYYKIF